MEDREINERIMSALESCDLQAVHNYIHLLLPPSDHEPYLRTCLKYAIGIDEYELTRFLLGNGADVVTDAYDILATIRERYDFLSLFLEYGANFTSRGKWGQSLLSGIYPPNLETDSDESDYEALGTIIQFLLNHGVQIDARDKDGHSVLWDALSRNDNAYAKMLTDHGASPDIPCFVDSCKSPIHFAVTECGLDMLKNLLNTPMNIDVRDNDGNTALHYAALSAYTEEKAVIVRLLVEKGADINARNLKNETPLFKAIMNQYGDTRMVGLLIELGADPYARVGIDLCESLDIFVKQADPRTIARGVKKMFDNL